MLNSAIPLRREVTTRQLPVGKGKTLRKLPDVTVSYILFSVHIKKDFGDPVTATLCSIAKGMHAPGLLSAL